MADLKISALTSATTPLAGTEVLPIVQSSTTVKVATNDLTVRNVRANATTGILQVTGPGTGTTRVMTTPDANFTAARTDASQSFTGTQTFVGSGGQSVRVYGGSAAHQWDIYGNGNNLRVGDNTGGGLIQFDTDLNMNGGNVIMGTSGKGIDFSATPGTGTSELLADYEEGTWTPKITPSTSGAVTYTTQDGTYTKVGRQVTIVFVVAGTKNTASGEFRIGGIPFNISGSAITGAINWYNPLGTPLINAVAFYLSSTLFRVGVITVASTDATAGSFSSAEVSSTFSLTGTLTYFV